VPHFKDSIPGTFSCNAANASSTCFIWSVVAVLLNLKQTTWWTFPAAVALFAIPMSISERRSARIRFITSMVWETGGVDKPTLCAFAHRTKPYKHCESFDKAQISRSLCVMRTGS
jgi:hypothetical protein